MTTPVIARSAAPLPDAIGRYRVTARLGKGAMGVVYAAFDDRVGREVALKVMMADLEHDPETQARFAREAQLTSRLQHRNIVTVYEMGESDGRPYIAMELLKGQTLGEFLKREQPPLEQKLDLMIQTCDGLAAAHAQEICHRDIKPGNLFVLADGAIKILDFGVARLASSQMTATGLVVGTPDYMSPEQARGHDVDARSDVFSAAAVFYFLLTGSKPFDARELPAILHKVVREDPPPIPESAAPAPLARMVMKALSKDPAARYQRSADFAADLIRFKRHFDTETRHAATAVQAQFARTVAAADDLTAVLRTLHIDDPAAAARGDALRARYPFLTASTDGLTVPSAPLRRQRLTEITRDLDEAAAEIRHEADGVRDLRAAIDAGNRALAVGDAATALRLFEGAAQSWPGAVPAIVEGLAQARARLAESRDIDARIRLLLEDARAADRRAEWPAVIARCEEALALRPGVPEAAALLTPARAALAETRARRGRHDRDTAQRERAAVMAADADRCFRDGKPADALRAAEAALAIDDAQELALRIQALARTRLRADAEAAARAADVSARLARATAFLAAKRYDKATREAARALELDPERAEAAALLAQARRLEAAAAAAREDDAVAKQRQRAAEKLLKQAAAAHRSGDFDTAAALAEQAVTLVPADAAARQLLEDSRREADARTSEDTVTITPIDPDDTATIDAATGMAGAVTRLGDWVAGLRRKVRSQVGQSTTEWLMVAGVLTFSAIALNKVMPAALKRFVTGLMAGIKSMAP